MHLLEDHNTCRDELHRLFDYLGGKEGCSECDLTMGEIFSAQRGRELLRGEEEEEEEEEDAMATGNLRGEEEEEEGND